MEKLFANNITDKGLILKMYKEFLGKNLVPCIFQFLNVPHMSWFMVLFPILKDSNGGLSFLDSTYMH